MKRLFLCLVTCVMWCSFACAQGIQKIEVTGNSRISVSTVEAYLTIKHGDLATQNQIDASIKSLFSTGFFSNIKIYTKDSILFVELEENPIISKIAFEGNTNIKDEDFAKELGMSSRSVFSGLKLQNDLKRMVSMYQRRGYYNVVIEPKIVKLDQNRIDLVYEIREGILAKIKKISFIGNNDFTSSKLSNVLFSKESRWYRFFSSVDVYDKDKLILDQELLREFYLNEGYADFELLSTHAELTPKKDAFIITFNIHEGAVYKFGDVTIISKIPGIDLEPLYKLLTFKKGTNFNQSSVNSTIDAITDHLGDNGYAFVDVDYDVMRERDQKIANVNITINETYKTYINKINIKNNTRTLDKVIRREFRIAEGDPYNATKIYRSNQRIRNLGFFNAVNFKNTKTTDEEDKVDVEVEVEERSTGTVNFAVGYNTSIGALGSIGLAETNFLGKGQQVSIDIMRAQKDSEIVFSFTEPYFMDYPLTAGFDIFNSNQSRMKRSSFNSTTSGLVLRLGYNITEYLSHGVRYSAKVARTSHVRNNATELIKDDRGNVFTSLVGHTLTYDRTDDSLSPSSGYMLKLSQDAAGLGGQSFYVDNKLVGAFYRPLYKRDVIFSAVARTGYITGWNGKRVRLSDRYFIDNDQMRGFDFIGPRDRKTKEELGGNIFHSLTLEVGFPVGLPKESGLNGFVFSDFGTLYGIDMPKGTNRSSVYDDHFLRASYGLGIRWTSAIGTITIDYGIPFRKKSYDSVRYFRVSIGSGM
ncbi:outer membrane protein assembly factor BamA [Rickettsiales endosymbiont of Peranema trichophorum]|uniref:outer membrane protein assembly factor BamA n=1 Tax=Rickettsiales endosymbiont of Peranema trichophorum TaxID=2486577 RepID=UPI0010236272|nr:outer membrane protein assembly factor BamA [Rickettsiales endosymbiont of Peranema trichophorum]RZI45637.1 outer membrane protein assembly factor BamA [Rickettsiales endosymbiont of Peranema trichophorum]